MKITFEGDYEEMRDIYRKLFISPLEVARAYADEAMASASKADTSARNALMALEDIKKLKNE